MHNITLVCTHHSEFGKSNSDELYRIIELVRPDVIFEELNQDLFAKFYKESEISYLPPEVKSVKKYILDHTINHIPVDINVSHTLTTNEIDYMFSVFRKYTLYSTLHEDKLRLVFDEGYSFLNSKKNEELTEKMKLFEKSIIEFQMDRNQLSRTHQLFYEEQHNREYEIIKNVYNYSEKVPYTQALLLIGSGHRKTIFEKIKKHESENHIKLKWSLYGD